MRGSEHALHEGKYAFAAVEECLVYKSSTEAGWHGCITWNSHLVKLNP